MASGPPQEAQSPGLEVGQGEWLEAHPVLGELLRVGGGFRLWRVWICALRPVPALPGSASPSMSRSFGESYRVGSTSGVHAITVFCSWDYKVTQKWASRLQHDNIRTQLKVSRRGPGAAARHPVSWLTSRNLSWCPRFPTSSTPVGKGLWGASWHVSGSLVAPRG